MSQKVSLLFFASLVFVQGCFTSSASEEDKDVCTQQLAAAQKDNRRLSAERIAALKLVEEKQVELDDANRRLQSAAAQRVNNTSNTSASTNSSYKRPNRDRFYECIVDGADSWGRVRWDFTSTLGAGANSCSRDANCKSKTEYKLCWMDRGLGYHPTLDQAMSCWDSVCE